MKSGLKSLVVLAFSALMLASAAVSPAQTGQTRETQLSTEGGNFPLYVTVEYLDP